MRQLAAASPRERRPAAASSSMMAAALVPVAAPTLAESEVPTAPDARVPTALDARVPTVPDAKVPTAPDSNWVQRQAVVASMSAGRSLLARSKDTMASMAVPTAAVPDYSRAPAELPMPVVQEDSAALRSPVELSRSVVPADLETPLELAVPPTIVGLADSVATEV